MKANELMIGDWVRVKAPYFKKNKAYRVVEVREHGYNAEATANIELPDEDDEASMTGEYIIGIPITPEILEKNGFTKSERYEVWKTISDDYELRITPWRVAVIFLDEDGSDKEEFSAPRPKYVHELQHALRMCGIEKDIVL